MRFSRSYSWKAPARHTDNGPQEHPPLGPNETFVLHQLAVLVSQALFFVSLGRSGQCDNLGAGELTVVQRRQRVSITPGRSSDIDARDVKAQEAAEGCAEYERPQEYRQYR